MSDKPNPLTTMAILAGLGLQRLAPGFRDMTCVICEKPIEPGTGHRQVAGIGRFHPECDPREKGPTKS